MGCGAAVVDGETAAAVPTDAVRVDVVLFVLDRSVYPGHAADAADGAAGAGAVVVAGAAVAVVRAAGAAEDLKILQEMLFLLRVLLICQPSYDWWG